VYSDVYVVFTNDDGYWWSPFLHPFIKHCYVVIPDRGRWIIYGKVVKSLDIFTVDDKPFKLDENVVVVKVKAKQTKQGLFMLNTCVSHTKQILGINDPFILTPWQLLKRLKHEETKGT